MGRLNARHSKFHNFLPALALLYLAAVLVAVSAIAADVPSIAWMKLTPATSPTPRSFMAMTYDVGTHRVVMFGGSGSTGYLNDTWTFDGITWTKVNTPVAPPARAAAQMAYDRKTHNVVLFGGYDGTHDLSDTWLWDGSTSTWTEATPQHSPVVSLFQLVGLRCEPTCSDIIRRRKWWRGPGHYLGLEWLGLEASVSHSIATGA